VSPGENKEVNNATELVLMPVDERNIINEISHYCNQYKVMTIYCIPIYRTLWSLK